MLDFRSVKIQDIESIKKFTADFNEYSCELTSVNLIMWQEHFGFTFCIDEGVLYTKNCIDGRVTFGIPFTRNMKPSIEKIKEYAAYNNIPVVFFGVQGDRLELFKAQADFEYSFEPVRDSFEYIYSYENLASLSGKKYHSKRNHISAFKKRYNWSYEKIDDGNYTDVIKMLEHWYNSYTEKSADTMEAEKNKIADILAKRDSLNLRGGLLRVDGNIIAVTLGCEISSEVFDVNFEKALVEFDGAYAMINQQFVVNELYSYKYINREDDLGIEGLRKAKLSYKPEILLEKFIIVPEF